jgi:4-diphosphocytidyl-2-C-methyl-D-erythritol kinase
MISFPPVKINLGLYVTERRPDQYHNILSCFYPVKWNDVLEIVPSDHFEFIQTGLTIPGSKEDNLCVKAYRLLASHYSLPPVRIHLHKIVPMGAGLGGGSSDASSTLLTLNTLFQLGLKQDQLEIYAAGLGSDCAFFIRNRPVIATEKGNVMQDIALDLKGNHLYILYPPVHVSTSDAYSGVQVRSFQEDIISILGHPKSWRGTLHNQFEATIFPKYPSLATLKQALYEAGAWYATMSGSGSAIVGLFEKELENPSFSCPFFHTLL